MSAESKNEIREKILNFLRNQKEEDRLRKSLMILEKLLAVPEFQYAKTILFYSSFDGEVDTFDMMKQAQHYGKKIALPKIIKEDKRLVPILINAVMEDCELGPYGIQQPRKELNTALRREEIDMVIVPAVAFDKENFRLGRGAGYYDRFLKDLPKDSPTVGLAFDFQIVDHLPHQEHDIPVTRVIVN